MDVEITFEPSGQSGIVAVGTYLSDAAHRMGIDLGGECNSEGHCDSCAVKIKEGRELLSEITAAEMEHLSDAQRHRGKRLACQAKIVKEGELVVMVAEKKQDEKTSEEQRVEDFRKDFHELPLEKKIANLLELEAVTLGETFSFVLNSPFKIFGKVMDVMAEFGLKLEDESKKAKRPAEHKAEEAEDPPPVSAGEAKPVERTGEAAVTEEHHENSAPAAESSEPETK